MTMIEKINDELSATELRIGKVSERISILNGKIAEYIKTTVPCSTIILHMESAISEMKSEKEKLDSLMDRKNMMEWFLTE